MIKTEPGLSRRELSRRICQRNGWYSPNGNLKDMSCRKALVELDRQGIIHLPAVEKVTNFTDLTPTERETDGHAHKEECSFVLGNT